MAMNKQQAGLLGSAGLGVGLGAGLMYLLDPQSGGRRRAVAKEAKDKTVHAIKKGGRTLGKKSRRLGNRGKSLVLGAASKLRKGHADDPDLHEGAEDATELKGDGSSTSFVRKAWAPALCTAATAGLAWVGFKNRDKLGSALSTALFLSDLGRRPNASDEAGAGGGIELKKTTRVTLFEEDGTVGFAEVEESEYVPVHS